MLPTPTLEKCLVLSSMNDGEFVYVVDMFGRLFEFVAGKCSPLTPHLLGVKTGLNYLMVEKMWNSWMGITE